jgi:hypothetical protein
MVRTNPAKGPGVLEPAAWHRPRVRERFRRAAALPGVRGMLAEQELELPEWVV